MHIVKLENCTLCIICISFSFVHTPVCANCKSDSCNRILFKKKKKKKKKNDPYFDMGKNTKVMPQKTPYLSSFLGKGKESLHLQTLLKKLSLVCFLPCPQARKTFLIQTLCGRHTPKLTKNSFFPQISHLSSNRRVCNLTLYFQFTTPARELTHGMKFEKGTNFGSTMFLRYLDPEKCQILSRKARILEMPCFFTTLSQRNTKSYPERHEFWKHHVSSLP